MFFIGLHVDQAPLQRTSHSPRLLGRRKELGSAVVLPPGRHAMLEGVAADLQRDALNRERENLPDWRQSVAMQARGTRKAIHAPVRVAGLTHRLHQAFHASVIRLLMFPRLHEKQYHLIQLQHRPCCAPECAALRPPFPVYARDAEAQLPRLSRQRIFQEVVQEGGGLAALRDELDAIHRAEQPALPSLQQDAAQDTLLRNTHSLLE